MKEEEIYEFFSQCGNVTSLDLSHFKVDEALLPSISSFTNLVRLNMSNGDANIESLDQPRYYRRANFERGGG